MPNRHGCPIWYELMTPDPDGAAAFYQAVAGWRVAAEPPGGPDYRMIFAGDATVAGMLTLDEAMKAGGAGPAWLPYFGVDGVDETADKAASLGATMLVPPTDIPNIGRFALIADPQGAPFYVMRGASEQESTAFAPLETGHFAWNELSTSDGPAALAFYGALFGFENRETMDMGPMGGYHFLDLGDARLGAMVEMKDQPVAWRLYARVADVDAAAAVVGRQGGTVSMGPHDVPSGDRIVIAIDPQGAEFALVGPGRVAA